MAGISGAGSKRETRKRKKKKLAFRECTTKLRGHTANSPFNSRRCTLSPCRVKNVQTAATSGSVDPNNSAAFCTENKTKILGRFLPLSEANAGTQQCRYEMHPPGQTPCRYGNNHQPCNNIKKWRYLHVFRVKIPNSEAERQMHKKRHNTAKRKGPATASLNERSGCGVPVGNANLTTALCYALAKGPEPVWRPQSKAAEISGGSWL